jgi:uncharacterized membrane protein HdeD (DUF308 family)
MSHASHQTPENQLSTDGAGVHWAARLRFGTRTLLLGLTGIAAAAPLTSKGLIFNAIALVLTGLALMLQTFRKRVGRAIGAQLVIAMSYTVAATINLLVPQYGRLGAYAIGAALLTAGAARVYMAHRVLDRLPAGVAALGAGSGLLGVMAITGWPMHAQWQLGFLVAAELVCAGVSSLHLGFAQWARQRAASLPD